MKTMFVFKLPTPVNRPQRYARMGHLNFKQQPSCVPVNNIDDATKFNNPAVFSRIFPGEQGEPEEVGVAVIESKHKAAMHFLKGLLDKEIEFAREQEQTALVPEDRKDACRDYEMMELIKEVLGL
ncbi:hypothetical protein VBJ55_22570 [Enterobacter hormaechei]|nr:hypothetical protein [Enterobacter hormaechei]